MESMVFPEPPRRAETMILGMATSADLPVPEEDGAIPA
jgi:hypothetical protein